MSAITIYLQRTIDSSHVIDGHTGKCARLHGHTYRFEVWMQGPAVAGDSMLIDFGEVKEAIDEWDHVHLNDVVPFVPTAELLALEMHRRLHDRLQQRFPSQPVHCRLRLWETPTSYAQVGSLGMPDGD